MLAFQFTDQAAEIDLTVERRKPYVTAQQRMLVQVEEGVVKYEVLLMLHIQYSGIKSVRVDVPAGIAGDVRNLSDQLRNNPILPPPNDIPPGYVSWEFSGETELLGTHSIKLNWETKIDELEVGSSTRITVPRIEPKGVDRSWGQIVISKSETLDVEPSAAISGLRSIDPNLDIMAEARVSNAARAFEFVDDWSLQLSATRYQLEEVKRTSLERGVVRVVVTRSGLHSVQAMYRLKSARQRLALKLPEGVEFDSQPVRINGAPVVLERGEQGFLTVPLIGQDPQTSFVLELRYSLPGDYREMHLPEFPEDPAVQKVFLAVYLPQEVKLLANFGPWTEETLWRWRNWRIEPTAKMSDDSLTKWINEDIKLSAAPAFQKDGWFYLFSTLRPAPAPTGSLQLQTMPSWMLNASVVGAMLLLGLVFLRTRLSSKLVVCVLLIMLLTGLGFLAPTLAQQLLSLPAVVGLALLGIAWWAWHAKQVYDAVDWRRSLGAGLVSKDSELAGKHGDSGQANSGSQAGSNETAAAPHASPASEQSIDEEGKQGGDHV